MRTRIPTNCVKFDVRVLLAEWDDDTTTVDIAQVLGVNRQRVADWRRSRGHMIPWWQADEYAIRAGTHPAVVWHDWITKALEETP